MVVFSAASAASSAGERGEPGNHAFAGGQVYMCDRRHVQRGEGEESKKLGVATCVWSLVGLCVGVRYAAKETRAPRMMMLFVLFFLFPFFASRFPPVTHDLLAHDLYIEGMKEGKMR